MILHHLSRQRFYEREVENQIQSDSDAIACVFHAVRACKGCDWFK